MNPKINYTLVGGFVVLLVLGGLFFISFMTQDSRNVDRLPYVTYFYSSVSGLNERAAVKYRGVPVGYVEKISLANDPERVRLNLRLDSDLSVRTNTFATLQFQGITGLLFVELQSSNEPGEQLNTSEKVPAVIASQGSRLIEITENLDLAVQNFNQLTLSLNRLSDQLGMFTDPNMQQQVTRLLTSLEQLSNTAEARISTFDPEVFHQLARDFSTYTEQMQNSLSTELQQMGQQLQNLSQDTQTSTRLLGPLLLQAETLAEQLRLESNTWIRGNRTQPSGPGE